MWNFDYNVNDVLTHYSHPNGMLTQHTYDNQNRLSNNAVMGACSFVDSGGAFENLCIRQ